MALFYLIRHGEPTYDNLMEHGFFGFGRDLAPLTEEGKKHAEITAKDARLKDAALIVSSPHTGVADGADYFQTDRAAG